MNTLRPLQQPPSTWAAWWAEQCKYNAEQTGNDRWITGGVEWAGAEVVAEYMQMFRAGYTHKAAFEAMY